MRVKLRWPAGLIGEATDLVVIAAIVSGLVWLWWWATPRPTGPADIITGKVFSIVVDPNRYSANNVRMLVNAGGNIQVGLADRTSGFLGCKVGSDIKMRRINSSTGFIGYKFVPGSCSS